MNYAQHLQEDKFVIFLFHGVIEKQVAQVRNYTRKHLEKDYFAGKLQGLISAGGNPVSMDDIASHHAAGEPLPPRSFAVTFDDGFLNNLTVAAPVLADLSIPATFYVTTDFIQSNRMSWVDRIEWAIEQTASGLLHLPWRNDAHFSDADSKRQLLDEIRRHVKSDRKVRMDDLASDIQRQLGLPETWASENPLDRKMDWSEVARLHGHPLFVVGGHSHSHAILSFLTEDELEYEIAHSLELLRDNAAVPPKHYSYPEGLAHCYSESVIARLKRHNVQVCPSAIDGKNDASTDLFHLRRIMAV